MIFLFSKGLKKRNISKMTGEEIKNKILDWESRYPVSHWLVDEIYIWPHVRNKLYIYLLNLDKNFPGETNQESPQPSKPYLKKLLDLSFKIFWALKAIFIVFLFFLRLNKKQIVFFGSHFHRTKHLEGYFNRFFDSMVAYHHLHETVYMVEFQKVYRNNFNPQAIIPLHFYLDQYKLISKIGSIFKKKAVKTSLVKYSDFYINLIEEFPNASALRLKEIQLIKWASKIKSTSGFFIRMFKKVNPEKILFLSYNGFDDNAAALLAANELNIKTIDFQHGPQTNVHMVYSHWTKTPLNLYNTMPLEYWCWDTKTKENIDVWAKNSLGIKSKVAGHPYIGFWESQLSEKSIDQPYILYSLQLFELEKMFPPRLISVINNSKQKWVLRLHPRSHFNAEELKNFLKGRNVDSRKYMVENSYDAPLPKTILKSFVHITNFSGCLLETNMMAVPSIIIDKYGKEIYQNYLDNETVFYCDKEEDGFENQFFKILDRLESSNVERNPQVVVNPLTF